VANKHEKNRQNSCRNVLPVYLFIFQLHYFIVLAATVFMVNEDYQ